VKTERWLNRVTKFLTCSFDTSEMYIVARQSRLSRNKAVFVLKDHHDQQFLKVGHALSAHMREVLSHHTSTSNSLQPGHFLR